MFSTGTRTARLAPRSFLYAAIAAFPENVGLSVPSPLSSFFSGQIVPMPRTWPISWVMTSLSVPSVCIFFRSSVSKVMMPLAGSSAAAPEPSGRTWVGPAWPRILPGPVDGPALRLDEDVVDDVVADAYRRQVPDDGLDPAVGGGREGGLLPGIQAAEEAHLDGER